MLIRAEHRTPMPTDPRRAILPEWFREDAQPCHPTVLVKKK